jgi:hypothetical protein
MLAEGHVFMATPLPPHLCLSPPLVALLSVLLSLAHPLSAAGLQHPASCTFTSSHALMGLSFIILVSGSYHIVHALTFILLALP